MHSADSIQTIFDTYNSLNTPAIDTPCEFYDSEPSPTNNSQPPFVPLTPLTPIVLSISSFSYTIATPILSPISSNIPDALSPMTDD